MTNEDQLKTSPVALVKIFLNNLQQSQEGKELFRKTKKVLIKIYKTYANCKLPHKFISLALR